MSFGKQLEKARKARGFRREDIAAATGVCVPTVVRWEQSKVIPKGLRVAVALEDVLGVDLRAMAGPRTDTDGHGRPRTGMGAAA